MRRADTIRDFVQGMDKIDLSGIDASRVLAGNNAFVFSDRGRIGTSDHGEITFVKHDRSGRVNDVTVVLIDNDGDMQVEARIRLEGLFNLTADDFIL